MLAAHFDAAPLIAGVAVRLPSGWPRLVIPAVCSGPGGREAEYELIARGVEDGSRHGQATGRSVSFRCDRPCGERLNDQRTIGVPVHPGRLFGTEERPVLERCPQLEGEARTDRGIVAQDGATDAEPVTARRFEQGSRTSVYERVGRQGLNCARGADPWPSFGRQGKRTRMARPGRDLRVQGSRGQRGTQGTDEQRSDAAFGPGRHGSPLALRLRSDARPSPFTADLNCCSTARLEGRYWAPRVNGHWICRGPCPVSCSVPRPAVHGSPDRVP